MTWNLRFAPHGHSCLSGIKSYRLLCTSGPHLSFTALQPCPPFSGALSVRAPHSPSCSKASPSFADKPQDSHSHISVAALCSGEPGSLPSASFSMTLLHHFHGSDGEESACSSGDAGEMGLIPAFGKIPWRRVWQPTPVFLPREFHRGHLWVTVQGVAKSQTLLSHFHSLHLLTMPLNLVFP